MIPQEVAKGVGRESCGLGNSRACTIFIQTSTEYFQLNTAALAKSEARKAKPLRQRQANSAEASAGLRPAKPGHYVPVTRN
ncbi:hypothetical protein [Bacterioplanoides sp.]|uniref:hypothetical protein n=1 Tax=Bacterioplanoides sp. TaxID=2066072 RepID=UPI003B5BCA0E